ncbi:hypothetical protein ACFL4F_01075 [Candidatus Margulisiibacteriota bacterium]
MRKSLILTILFLFALSTASYALRPLSTDNTGTTYQGGWKVETWLDSETLNSTSTSRLGVKGKYGLTTNFEFQGAVSYQSVGGTSGRGPIDLLLKYRFNEESGTTPSFGVRGGISLPETGDSTITVRALLTDTKKDFTYHTNLGLATSGSRNGIFYGGALVFQLNNDLKAMGELFGSGLTEQLFTRIGGTLRIKKNIHLDGAIKLGLSTNTPSGFTIGVSVLI